LALPAPLGLLSDERLARLVGQGNERAFNTLYSRYHQALYRYCHSMVRSEADAQDALQSTFMSALTALRRSQRDAPLRPWLYRIAHNESISLLRRRRTTDELPETMESAGPSVEDAVEDRARLTLLVSDLRSLPERQRGALVMRELSGLSHEELAQALGISVGAAKQSVFEARQAMQEFAEGRAMACSEIQRVISDGDKRALRGRRIRAHLRECSNCEGFAGAIPERRAALLALSPALPAVAASGLLAKVTGAVHHGGNGGGALAGAGGKTLGVALSAKSVATGIAIVATATVGTVGAVEVVSHSGHGAVHARPFRSNGAHGASAAGSAAAAGHSHRGSGQSGRANGHNVLNMRAGASAGGAAGSHGTSSALLSSTHRQAGASAQPNAGGTNPNAHSGNPNAGGGNTGGSGNAGGTNPNAHGGNPNAGGGNPNAGGGNPNAHGGNPNAGGGNPNAHGGNPNAGGGNPNAGGGNTGGSGNAGGTNPNAHGGNPNAGGGNPNAHGGNPNAGGGTKTTTTTTTPGTNPNAHGGNPHAHGGH
jgi:RNA polymerase sigma factor (sigma-70 family)